MAMCNQDNSIYVVLDGSIILNKTAKEVWPYILNYTLWQDFSYAEHISGVEGGEGEVVRLKYEEEGLEEIPSYCGRTLKIVPEKHPQASLYSDDEK